MSDNSVKTIGEVLDSMSLEDIIKHEDFISLEIFDDTHSNDKYAEVTFKAHKIKDEWNFTTIFPTYIISTPTYQVHKLIK